MHSSSKNCREELKNNNKEKLVFLTFAGVTLKKITVDTYTVFTECLYWHFLYPITF